MENETIPNSDTGFPEILQALAYREMMHHVKFAIRGVQATFKNATLRCLIYTGILPQY